MVQTRSAAKKANLITDRDSDRTEPQREDTSAIELTASASAENDATSAVQQRSKRVNARKNGPKTQRTSRRQSMRGKLAMLPEMNLDVLSQILSYLQPTDLLNLARLTKPFREFLMSKSHAFVWVAARKQVGLPECPPDLSEPEYANLAFDPHCHNCGGVVHTIYWQIRRRYCPKCRTKRLRLTAQCDGLPDTINMVPSEYLEGIIERRGGSYFVDKQQYDAVYKEYLKTPIGKRDAFVDRRRKIVANMREKANECELWNDAQINARNLELSYARMARQESIFARLESAGYARDIQYIGEIPIVLSRPDVFRTSKALTEKEWKDVYSKLEPKMIEFRAERLEEQVFLPRRNLLISVYNRYIQSPAPEGGAVDMLPSIWDVAHFAPFDAIIKLPEDEIVEATTFTPAVEQLPALARQWREKVDVELAHVVNIGLEPSRRTSADRQSRLDASPKECLQLACAVFEVRDNDRLDLFTYPRLLVESKVFYEISDRLGTKAAKPWSLPKEESKSVQLFSGASDVVAACGLDPRIATVDDMEKANARLMCNECGESSLRGIRVIHVFDWKTAIHHVHSCHRDNLELPQRWTLVDQNLVPSVEAQERHYTNQTPPISIVRCALCQLHALATNYEIKATGSRYCRRHHHQLSTHLSDAHGIKKMEGPLQENVHYIASRGLVTRPEVRMLASAFGPSFRWSWYRAG